MKSTNKNFIYNVIYQVFTFIIPLVSTPYISRILGLKNIGIYSYTYLIGNKEIIPSFSKKIESVKNFFWE